MTEKEIETRVDFLSSAKCNHTPHKYIDITGDLIQGTLLARILYWFAEDKNKQRKVRIFKGGYFWIAKQRKDWWEEIRISERQYDKAIKGLEEKGFVVLAKYKFNSMPTIHIRPDYDNINDAVEKWEDELREEIIKEDSKELQEYENGNNTKCNSQGNDVKCKTGITQESNLLTGITNNDYSNKNYITDTTDNSFSKEKDLSNSPQGMCNSFSREKKDTHTPKQKKPLSEKELEQANYKMPFRACEIAYRLTQNKDLANNVMQFFQYFLDERKKHTGKWHIPLSDTTLAKVVATLIEDIKVDRGDYEDTYFSLVIDEPGNKDYKEVVDKYFKTKFKSKVDYSIVHFAQENVLINIMNHCGKENWCMSGI